MPLHGKLGEARSPAEEGEQTIYGAGGKPASITLGIQDLQGSQGEACLLWAINFSARNFVSDLSEAQPRCLPRDREVRGLGDTLLNSRLGWIWASPPEVLSTTETFCQWAQLLPLSCHTMGPSLLCPSNQNALLWFWALPGDAEENFFPNLVIKSVWPASHLQKEDFMYHVQALAYLQCRVSSWEKSGASEESKQ